MHRTQGPHRAEEREVALPTTLCPRAGEAFCLSELWRSVPWALVCPHMLWEAVGQAESPTENGRSSSEATEHEIPGVVRRSVHSPLWTRVPAQELVPQQGEGQVAHSKPQGT